MKITRFFAPATNSGSANFALLVLRVWLGVAMLLNHGWDKLNNFHDLATKFKDILHIGSPAINLALVVFAEAVCSALLVLGLFTRFAALMLAITMGVAFIVAHHMKLTGDGNGELPFIYLAGYITLLIAGPGRYSADAMMFEKSAGK